MLSSTSITESGKTSQYNYTWIMNRGDRTYTKSFRTIRHGNMNVFVDLNAEESFLLVMDEEKLVNYALDVAILGLTLKNN